MEYGVVTILSIVLALLFGRMRLRFTVAAQFTCAGLVAALLERGDYRFTDGATYAFPADVARRVMEKQKYFPVAPPQPDIRTHAKDFLKMLRLDADGNALLSRHGYYHGVNRLFEQFQDKLPQLVFGVLGILILSLFFFALVFYVCYVIADGVSSNLSVAVNLGTPNFWGACLGASIAIGLSLRMFPYYSFLLLPIGLLVDLKLLWARNGTSASSPPTLCQSFFDKIVAFGTAFVDTIALAASTVTALLCILASWIVFKNAAYPFLIYAVHRVKRLAAKWGGSRRSSK